MQAQIHICKVDFCDFVVWTPKSQVTLRILPDSEFWKEVVPKLSQFYKRAIIPGHHPRIDLWLVYRRNSRPNLVTDNPAADASSDVFCLCRQGEDFGDMIACDANDCKIEWYHQKCVGIKKAPRGRWICQECKTKTTQRKRNKSSE